MGEHDEASVVWGPRAEGCVRGGHGWGDELEPEAAQERPRAGRGFVSSWVRCLAEPPLHVERRAPAIERISITRQLNLTPVPTGKSAHHRVFPLILAVPSPPNLSSTAVDSHLPPSLSSSVPLSDTISTLRCQPIAAIDPINTISWEFPSQQALILYHLLYTLLPPSPPFAQRGHIKSPSTSR